MSPVYKVWVQSQEHPLSRSPAGIPLLEQIMFFAVHYLTVLQKVPSKFVLEQLQVQSGCN